MNPRWDSLLAQRNSNSSDPQGFEWKGGNDEAVALADKLLEEEEDSRSATTKRSGMTEFWGQLEMEFAQESKLLWLVTIASV